MAQNLEELKSDLYTCFNGANARAKALVETGGTTNIDHRLFKVMAHLVKSITNVEREQRAQKKEARSKTKGPRAG